jgi:hypothetical protein
MKTKDNYQESVNYLKKIFEVDRTVYTMLNHVSGSGMTRHISLFVARNNRVLNITWYVADVLGYKRSDKTGGLVVSGCGMDMGFHVVYSLGNALYPNGDSKTVTGRNGDTKPETDGGYLLKHEWV